MELYKLQMLVIVNIMIPSLTLMLGRNNQIEALHIFKAGYKQLFLWQVNTYLYPRGTVWETETGRLNDLHKSSRGGNRTEKFLASTTMLIVLDCAPAKEKHDLYSLDLH